MSLLIFKFGLPVLLGYTLFVGLAGRLNPFAKPFYPEERPSWLLGLWTGLSVAIVLALGLHLAYGQPLGAVEQMIRPAASFLAAMLVPGFIVYFLYRNKIHRQLSEPTAYAFEGHDADEESVEDTHNLFSQTAQFASLGFDEAEFEEIDRLTDSQDVGVDRRQTDVGSPSSRKEQAPIIASFLTDATLQNISLDDSLEALNDDDKSPQTAPDTHGQDGEQVGGQDEGQDETPTNLTALETSTANTLFSASEGPAAASSEMRDHGASEAMADLQARLLDEKNSHEETAKHLRITRKALSLLEAESRGYESAKADSVIKLEEQLAASIEMRSKFESQAIEEKNQRAKIESDLVTLKQNLVQAKREIRRSAATRAKALSTANKSVAFARQAVEIRSQLEAELEESRNKLKNRQTTISSLIRELEREKNRTQDELSQMAQQLVLHEKQTKARRSLEKVAKNVENKLSSRLVKKVARARPVITDL